MQRSIVITGGRVIDPSQNVDRVTNLLIVQGRIAGIDVTEWPHDVELIDASGQIVAPGLVDIGVQLREPGFEEDETIRSGLQAALRGGITTVACTPDTDPPLDSPAGVEFVRHQADRAGWSHVCVLACISKHRAGEQLAEMGTLAAAGAVGFTDADAPIANGELMRRALQYSQMFGLPIFDLPIAQELARDGIMHEGYVSTVLGISGMPAEAEDLIAGRDIRLAEATGGKLHLLSVSTAGTVDLVARAKSRGVSVTAGVNLPNLLLTDEALRSFNACFKLQPPLRPLEHRDRCLAALKAGELDVISSGHTPRAAEKKMNELDVAPFGAVGVETLWGLVGAHLVAPGHLTWNEAVRLMSVRPAEILQLAHKGSLRVGSDADVMIFDPQHRSPIEPLQFLSASRNTPFAGWAMLGQPHTVLVAGQVKLWRGAWELAELSR